MGLATEEPAERAGETRLRLGGWPLLLVLAAVQFTFVLDFVIMMPLGPHYQRELSITPKEFGMLVAAYAFGAAVSGLAVSWLLDRFDRKHALLSLYAGFLVATLGCGLAPGFWSLLLARTVAGAFGGVIGAVSLAIVGDTFPERRRGLATGVLMSSFSVAQIVGVPAGLFLAGHDGSPGAPFVALAGLSAVLWLLAGVLIGPLRRHLDGKRHHLPPWAILMERGHVPAYLLMSVLVLSIFMLVPYLPMFLVCNLGYAEDQLFLVYLCSGLTTLVTLPLIGRLADRFGKLRIFRIFALLTAAVIVLLTNLSPPMSAVVVLLVTTLFTVSTSGRMVPAMALITSSTRPATRGSFMSLIASVQQMASGLSAVLAGLLMSQADKGAPLEGYPVVGLLAAAGTTATVFLAGWVRTAQPETLPATTLEAAAEGEVVAEGFTAA
jgi:predicted MFS family arabinose efflux permease